MHTYSRRTRGISENIHSTLTPVCRSFLTSEEQSEITETGIDFLQHLGLDVCIYILSFLDDPIDVVRVGAVSRFWHQCVIANGVAKQLCLKVVPQFSTIAGVVVTRSTGTSSSAEAETSTSIKSIFFERDHTVYASLLHAIKVVMVPGNICIEHAISTSSTINFPGESISNTQYPRDGFHNQYWGWSIKGESNPELPETLIYKLRTGLWLITNIDIEPFQAIFQHGRPIYSARSVRFRMGHPKSANEMSSVVNCFPLVNPVDDKFVWTYTSPEFPMVQGNVMQRFKLPGVGVPCLGGYVQIELLGRVQRQENDGLFYICMGRVRFIGRALFPEFNAEIEEATGEMLLSYDPEFRSLCKSKGPLLLLDNL